MKALSIRQPYIDQILQGVKILEYRSWRTHYRGELLLCSSKRADCKDPRLPLGVALCVVELQDVFLNIVNPSNGFKYAWRIKIVEKIARPFPVKGKLSFFEVNYSR